VEESLGFCLIRYARYLDLKEAYHSVSAGNYRISIHSSANLSWYSQEGTKGLFWLCSPYCYTSLALDRTKRTSKRT